MKYQTHILPDVPVTASSPDHGLIVLEFGGVDMPCTFYLHSSGVQNLASVLMRALEDATPGVEFGMFFRPQVVQ